jgi:DNA-binding MarR family transcriptional regulator
MGERYLRSVRLLAECMQGFERHAGEFVRSAGLTHAQFDIVATLGNTEGMSYKELGERTLITKGTLTPVLDRLEAKGLITRCKGANDGRQILVRLTPAGQRAYEETFMPHVTYMRRFLDTMPAARQEALIGLLGELRRALEAAEA